MHILSILALFAHDCQQNWWRCCQRCGMVTVVDAIINGFLLINIILLTLPWQPLGLFRQSLVAGGSMQAYQDSLSR